MACRAPRAERIGIEAFESGHERGASHDTSRIIRHSYHTPAYVALTFDAYDEWARLEDETGEKFVTITGGLDLFPPDARIPMTDYTSSMDAHGIAYDVLDVGAVGSGGLRSCCPTGRRQSTSAAPESCRRPEEPQQWHGAHRISARRCTTTPASRRSCRDPTASTWLTADRVVSAGRVVVTADAWTAGLLAPLGVDLPLTVTEEQITYFSPPRPAEFGPDVFPVWIWMDEPSYYGFPTYGEHTIKAAQDCGGPTVTADDRSGALDHDMQDRLSEFMRRVVPGSGSPVRSKRCLYTLTPDRDFIVDRLPGHPCVTVGLGAGHGFKFAALFGRLLTEIAVDGESSHDLSALRLDREALNDPSYVANWMV